MGKNETTQIVKLDPETIQPMKIEEVEKAAPQVFNDGAEYHVIVMVNGQLFHERKVPLLKRANIMKSVRQNIRARGLSITKAVVHDEIMPDLFTKTIIFDGVEITDKPITKIHSAKGQADKDWSAEAIEIAGIVHDDELAAVEKNKELSKYDRHALIFAANQDAGNDNLKGRATKKQAIAALLG